MRARMLANCAVIARARESRIVTWSYKIAHAHSEQREAAPAH